MDRNSSGCLQHFTSNKRAVSPALLSQPVPFISTRCTAPVSKPRMLQSMLVSTLSYRLRRDLRAAVATASKSPDDWTQQNGQCQLADRAWSGVLKDKNMHSQTLTRSVLAERATTSDRGN